MTPSIEDLDNFDTRLLTNEGVNKAYFRSKAINSTPYKYLILDFTGIARKNFTKELENLNEEFLEDKNISNDIKNPMIDYVNEIKDINLNYEESREVLDKILNDPQSFIP